MEVRECRRHPSAILWLYRNGKRVQSVALRWWEIPAIRKAVLRDA
jgi:hypothetical protein